MPRVGTTAHETGGNLIVVIYFAKKMIYNDPIGKDRLLFWAYSPHSKLICGSLICTTTRPALHGKRTHSKISKDRAPCRKFSRKEVPFYEESLRQLLWY